MTHEFSWHTGTLRRQNKAQGSWEPAHAARPFGTRPNNVAHGRLEAQIGCARAGARECARRATDGRSRSPFPQRAIVSAIAPAGREETSTRTMRVLRSPGSSLPYAAAVADPNGVAHAPSSLTWWQHPWRRSQFELPAAMCTALQASPGIESSRAARKERARPLWRACAPSRRSAPCIDAALPRSPTDCSLAHLLSLSACFASWLAFDSPAFCAAAAALLPESRMP